MFYPASIQQEEDGFTVTFPDIPEAITFAATLDESIEMAQDALVTAMEFYFEDKREVPSPSKLQKGQYPIHLPASLSAKVLLLNEMLRQKVRPSELARRLHTTAQEVNRLTNLHHTTRIDGIADALEALGKRLEIQVV